MLDHLIRALPSFDKAGDFLRRMMSRTTRKSHLDLIMVISTELDLDEVFLHQLVLMIENQIHPEPYRGDLNLHETTQGSGRGHLTGCAIFPLYSHSSVRGNGDTANRPYLGNRDKSGPLHKKWVGVDC